MLDLTNATIGQLLQGLAYGDFTSVELTNTYLARIFEVNHVLRAVICTGPQALQHAAASDARRLSGQPPRALEGIPILVKDNICISHEDGMNTTAGSFALVGVSFEDASLITRLRNAGAVILGKANLSQWAKFRDDAIPNGWSSVGGQVTSPFYKDGSAMGSSGGSGVASAAGLAAATLGTETRGSIIAPSSFTCTVGIKPTVGLVSRHGIVPITLDRDTAGPMCRTVKDAALVLGAIAGRDPLDKATEAIPRSLAFDFSPSGANGLKGARIGVARSLWTDGPGRTANPVFVNPAVLDVFGQAIETMRGLGAEVVELQIDDAAYGNSDELRDALLETMVCSAKDDMTAFFKAAGGQVHDLEGLIALNESHQMERRFPQSRLQAAQASQGRKDPLWSKHDFRQQAAREAINETFETHHLDAFVLPGNMIVGFTLAGFPLITVPAGFAPDDTVLINHPCDAFPALYDMYPGRPISITFGGTAWSEHRLIELAEAFEQATQVRLGAKIYPDALPKSQLPHRSA